MRGGDDGRCGGGEKFLVVSRGVGEEVGECDDEGGRGGGGRCVAWHGRHSFSNTFGYRVWVCSYSY